jgi:uncharacterized damage-inducible protein DinB
MTRQQLLERREQFKLVHGVTIRAIDTFADGDLDFRPVPAVRTPRELIFHIYAQERALAEAARDGRFTIEAAGASSPEDPNGAAALASLQTVADVKAYAEACHQTAESIFTSMSDEDVQRPVEGPFGTFPAWQYFAFAYDEHWHHRGQLYTYLRLLGKEPPMLYDY